MKRIILLLMLIFFVQISEAQKKGTSLKKYNLKGNVKQITYFTYTTVGPVGTTIDTLQSPDKKVTEFDTCGNVSKETLYDRGGTIHKKLAYNYPDKETIIINYFDTRDNFILQAIDKYDKNGYEIEYTFRDGSGVTNRFALKNNKYGQLIEQDNYFKNDHLLSKTIFHYNDKGQKTSSDGLSANGKQFDKCFITNDSLKNSNHSETYDMNGKLEGTYSSVNNLFDQNGNWQVEKIESFSHTHYGDRIEKILIKRKIEYY